MKRLFKPLFKSTILLILVSPMPLSSQTVINSLSQETFDNAKGIYNYTYWKENMSNVDAYNNDFVNHTNNYKLAVNFGSLNIKSLDLAETTYTPKEAHNLTYSELFTSQQTGSINYAILKDGALIHAKAANPTNKDASWTYSQLAEYGKWCNRRFVDSVNFTNSLDTYGRFTGVEFTNWHNRFKITFRVKPRTTIVNGQLQFSNEMPAKFNNKMNDGKIYAFATTTDKGFALVPGETVNSTTISGNTITVKSSQMDLIAGQNYQVSIIFYPIKENLAARYKNVNASEGEVTITATQKSPNTTGKATVSYNSDEGLHTLKIPSYTMGYGKCETVSDLQNINISITNNKTLAKRVRLCFLQKPGQNIVGFSSMIRNTNGDPSGHLLQISKNWHGGTDTELYGGSQINEYTEIIVPANTTLNFDYTRVGAKWGETYAACSHQLSIVGYSRFSGQQWLEAALGSSGESICHSPDYSPGNSNVTDWRPFLVTNANYGGTSSKCSWTGNVGGIDFGVYYPTTTKQLQSEPTTKFSKYGPNLTETSVSFVSSDKKTKMTYTFFLNRSDDHNRTYYKVKFEALESTTFSRYDFFQLGGDNYRYFTNQKLAYGNENGLTKLSNANASNTASGYATAAIALTGNNPWVWAGDGGRADGSYADINIPTNNGFVIRDYKATFGGAANNIPYFRERTSQRSGVPVPSYCIVPPSNVTSFTAGDQVEFTVEVMLFPKQASDYYGPNQNFINALTQYGNSWEMIHRESSKNAIRATSTNNVVSTNYPLTVTTINNTAELTITGGNGYVPLVFSGLSSVSNPKLWKAENDCWQLVDQSNWGNDFWQAEFNEETGLFDLIYNVNQDKANDAVASIKYYLGETPPSPSIVSQSRIDLENWSSNSNITVVQGQKVVLAPQVKINNITTVGVDSLWSWKGPDSFTKKGRVLTFNSTLVNNTGDYTVNYKDESNCSNSKVFNLKVNLATQIDETVSTQMNIFPNPFSNTITVQLNADQDSKVEVINTLGQVLVSQNTSTSEITLDLNHVSNGLYIVKVTSDKYVITREVLKR